MEENDVFGTPRPNSIPISMAIHERNDPDGTLWGSFSAVSFKEHKFFQVSLMSYEEKHEKTTQKNHFH